jgi:hypothetical protein
MAAEPRLFLDISVLFAAPCSLRRASELPFPIGTPGDFLAWFREHLREGA